MVPWVQEVFLLVLFGGLVSGQQEPAFTSFSERRRRSANRFGKWFGMQTGMGSVPGTCPGTEDVVGET